jgi:hypothetical protein
LRLGHELHSSTDPSAYPEPVSSVPYVVPPLLLTAVLAVSAVAKVRDPRDTASVFRQLGVPALLVRLRAPRLLPYGELVLAAALIVAPGGWYTAAASVALLLFLTYFLVILRALRLPYPITCPCFGRLGLGEVTRGTLVRNGVLLLVALVAFVDSWRADGVVQRLRHVRGGLWWLGGAAVVVVAVVLLVVTRFRRTPAVFRHGEPDPGAYVAVPTPQGVLHGPDGQVTVWELSDAAARLLVFCDLRGDADVVARSRSWTALLPPVRVHLVADQGPGVDVDLGARVDTDVLLDPGSVVRHRLGVGSPGAVLLGTDRMLAGGPVHGLADIERLVSEASEELRAAGIGPGAQPAQ